MSTHLSSFGAVSTAPVLDWDYQRAFARHDGLISADEQERLRNSRVAIAGLGGVGGVHLVTLARLGIGRFRIADPDRFELPNFNRQYGAGMSTLGQSKAEVMAAHAREVNPELEIDVFPDGISAENIGEFLSGVDVFLDGLDFFSVDVRRMAFAAARKQGIWGITAGPIGFSTAWLAFSPTGMSFDQYFDLHDSMERIDQLLAFAVGLSPRATQLPYIDFSKVNISSGAGPSAGLACQLCSGVAAMEVLKLLTGRGRVLAAPHYFQFDAYRHLFRQGKLRSGNRHPLQRLRRWYLRRELKRRNVL